MNRREIKSRFNRLHVWRASGQRAPHKPLLALWAIGRCLRDEARMVSYADTREELKALLSRFGPPRITLHPEHPFWRMQKDGVWEVSNAEHIALTSKGDALVSSLLREDAHGGLLGEIYAGLQADGKLAVEIAYGLLDAHFPATRHDEVLQAVGIDPMFEYVRRRPRSRAFSNAVLAAYGQQCAVCALAIRLGNEMIGLEAAHIRWHKARGPDKIRNALSLCALHHKLFDAGAYTLSLDRVIVVSGSATGRGAEYMLGQYHLKPITLPVNDDDLPDPAFLQWHHKQVFVGQMTGLG